MSEMWVTIEQAVRLVKVGESTRLEGAGWSVYSAGENIIRVDIRVPAAADSKCPNGPDEDGTWPCNPQVLYGLAEAECQVCGRVAAWGVEQ
jgi:hypothetical protein